MYLVFVPIAGTQPYNPWNLWRDECLLCANKYLVVGKGRVP